MCKKKVAILLSVALLLLIPSGVFAAKTLLKPRVSAGGFYRDIVDRVEISADRTEFAFRNTDGSPMQAELTLSVKKTEADFYALIDRIDVTGMAYDSLELICETPAFECALPEKTPLPVRDGECVPLQWKVLLTFSAEAPVTLTPVLEIEFTSGLTPQTADGRLLQIPLTLKVE